MTEPMTQIRRELLKILTVVNRPLQNASSNIHFAIQTLKPNLIVSLARRSSDHVEAYHKHTSKLLVVTKITPIGPSMALIYHHKLNLIGSIYLSVSKLGKNLKVFEIERKSRTGDAISMKNDSGSSQTQVSDHTVILHAGPERSVTDTKKFVSSPIKDIYLVTPWVHDNVLLAIIKDFLANFNKTVKIDWPDVRFALRDRGSIFCPGRDPTFTIANKAVLKFKEFCPEHAKSYLASGILYAPVSNVDNGLPVIAFTTHDNFEGTLISVANELASKGTITSATSTNVHKTTVLPAIRTCHPLTNPIALIASFFTMIEGTAASCGINLDALHYRKKVIETV